MKATYVAPLLLAALLPAAAHSGERSEIGRELDKARIELRTELAQERAKLETENLSLGDSIQFGKRDGKAADKATERPKGEITPAGDLLIDGQAVAIDAAQRRLLLDYRAQVIGVARAGLEAGEKAALVALDATDMSMFGLIVGGLTGSLERRIENTVKKELQPAIVQICRRLPQLHAAQQSLAASIPAFRPYATLRREDVADCERDVQRDLAMR